MIDINIDSLLQYALEHDIINLVSIKAEAEMSKRDDIIKNHPYSIWQGKDGKWRTYIKDETYNRGKRLICKKNKEDLLDTIVNGVNQEEDNSKVTITDVFNEWNDKRLENGQIKKSSHIAYTYYYRQYMKDSPMKDMSISRIQPVDIQDLLEKSANQSNKTSFSKFKSIIRNVIIRAKKAGYIKFGVSEAFEYLQINNNQFKSQEKKESDEVFTNKERDKIFEYVINTKTLNNLFILFLFVTGLRIGEAIALDKSDIENYIIHVTKTMTKSYDEESNKIRLEVGTSTKTNASNRYVPVPEKYHWIVDEIIEMTPDNPIFVPNTRGYRLSEQVIIQAFRKICKNVGVDYKPIHKIRKTYITDLLNAGVNIKLVSSLVGHNSTITTEKFYYRDNKGIDEKIEILNNVFR